MVPKKGLPTERWLESPIFMGNSRVHKALKLICQNPFGLSSTPLVPQNTPTFRAIPRYGTQP
jgi:hypothetical protein